LLQIPPADGYEISIYSVFPVYFWLLLVIPLFVLFYRIIDLFKNSHDDSRSFYSYDIFLSIFASILSLSIFLLLPFFRGYYLYSGGDALTHLFYIEDISLNGHFGLNNLYPVIHIFVNNFSYLTGVDARILMFFVPLIFLILFIFSMYLLSSSFQFNKKESLFVILLSVIPIFSVETTYLTPSIMSFFMIPFVLYILLKSRVSSQSLAFSILFLTLLFIFPFFHPETTIFLIIILFVIYIYQIIGIKLLKNFYKNNSKNIFNLESRSLITPILIISIAFFVWFSSTLIFGNTIKTVYNSLILNVGASPVDFYSGIITRVQIPFTQLLELALKKYGGFVIYVGLAAIPSFSIFLKLISGKKVDPIKVILATIFVVLSVLGILFLFKNFIIGERPLKYVIMVSILISSLLISTIISKYYKKPTFFRKASFILVSVLIISATFIAYGNTYSSPTVNSYNYQVQTSDYSGLNFFFTQKNQSLPILSILVDQRRWRDLFSLRNNSILNIKSNAPVDHFGYDQGKNLGDLYSKDSYLLFNGLSERFYPEVYARYKNSWRFTPQDFIKLDNDPTVNLIYDNAEINIFYVKEMQ
jgi:hypothetical protein